ncbi:two-component system activity regulator YycH [Ligilactobacillus sp. LYQ112]|uniref:two-component system activity regulator YycH n=1 Tax=Ligilactobacillus sp. LYQ112 TaxID=3391060 RepID=UPI0039839ED4
MRMLKWLRENWLHIALLLALIISVTFSFLIWANPFQRPHSKRTPTLRQSTTQAVTRKVSDLYVPTTVVVNHSGGKQEQVQAKMNKIVRVIQRGLAATNAGRVTPVALTAHDYQGEFHRADTVILNYPDTIPGGLFKKLLHRGGSGDSFQVNHVMISTKNPDRLYLLDDAHRQEYVVPVRGTAVRQLVHFLVTLTGRRIPVAFRRIAGRMTVTYPAGLSLPQVSYLVNKQPVNQLVTRLMGANSSYTIDSRQQANTTTYTDSNQRLTVNQRKGVIAYDQYRHRGQRGNATTILTNNVKQLNNLDVGLTAVHFLGYSQQHHAVTYCSYVHGFPVISPVSRGMYTIRQTTTATLSVTLSQYGLQVAIPSEAGTHRVHLPATAEVFNQLMAVGIPADKVTGIMVGYRWRANKASGEVADLTPTYFVRINGQWQDYQQIIAHH